ncbi:AbiV family abortive infection protein [Peribacillus frigoritolerans]|uniref:AbiV family abortive infection protein n=1 Tax=Peribacillus frigoritolerans TaxID=450367 RepID=UPI0024C10969|nr:AbiV family abortive infection protein [Peribacillus frigoritolerans]WHX62768.1 AbiV family abortive infection protein [Peribacillus frigoritolerans]
MNNLSVAQLQEAYTKIFKNAEELLEEAKILFDNGKLTRSFTLSHLAYEELAKLPMVYHTATNVYFKKQVNWKTFRRRFQDHKEKIRSMILLLSMIVGTKIGKEEYENMNQFVEAANELKNQSLYTGFYDNMFQQPSECVSKESVELSYQSATKIFNFFSQKQYHKPEGIVKSLENVSKKTFERSNDLSNKNVIYTRDGRVFEFYPYKVKQLKLASKKRSKKQRKKK